MWIDQPVHIFCSNCKRFFIDHMFDILLMCVSGIGKPVFQFNIDVKSVLLSTVFLSDKITFEAKQFL